MTLNFLIVEDQAAMRAQLREFVQAAYPRAEIAVAADGAAALAAVEAQAPDLVLMDIQLPDADGIALTSLLLARLPKAKVIIVSQHSAGVYLTRAAQAGAFAYVSKHRIVEELLPLLERAQATNVTREAP